MFEFTIDIETVPSQKPGVKEAIAETIRPPGSMKKEETIARWEAAEKPLKVEEAYRKLALDGTYGELASIAWQWNDEETQGVVRSLGDPEEDLLRIFYEEIRRKIGRLRGDASILWIGHNHTDFDLRFLFQRSVILNQAPSISLPVNVPWYDARLFDTMKVWAGQRDYVKMDALCQALGLEGKESSTMSGDQVYDAMLEGRQEEVLEYNKDDVRRTYGMYQRLRPFVRLQGL